MDPLHATLATYRLDDCPAFDALSYAWGDSELMHPVFINRSRVMVTYNLSVALRHLRYTHCCRILWIDALCINQADMNERNHQVFLMNRVYSTAENVVVWLGEDRDRSDIAMGRLEDLAGGQEFAIREKNLLRDLIFNTLIDREWWGRLWIVQEVVLAKSDPIIMCGSRWLPWGTFMRGCFAVNIDTIPVSESRKNRNRVFQWYQLHYLRQRSLSQINLQPSAEVAMCLGLLLNSTKDFHAADARDKVYGCLGLLKRAEREVMRPDYKKPTLRVYADVAKHLLEHDTCSFFSRYSFSKTGRTFCPSWIPDFAAQESLNPSDPQMRTLRAHGNIQGQRCVSFEDHSNALIISGIFFDTVETVIELKGDQDVLVSQIPTLERLMEHATDRKIPSAFHNFSKLKKHEDILEVLTGGPGDKDLNLRQQYEVLAGRSEVPSSMKDAPSKYGDSLLFIINHILPGRFFFVTSMGFVGTAVGRVRMNDSVTFLFGETLPTILRPRGNSYSVVGAAYVSGIMNGELTDEMYKTGFVEKTSFIIR